ncbi:hypothetical protein [Aliikangiella sp. IMCC44632]
MLKKLFGKKASPVRKLTNPKDLMVGDMLELVDSFSLPVELRGKTFAVKAINTYEYEYSSTTEFLLEGPEQQAIHMSIESEDGEDYVNFTKKIDRSEVESLFDMDTFGLVFEETICEEKIEVIVVSGQYERWLAEAYRQQGEWSGGYYYPQDLRDKPKSHYQDGQSEPFESVSLAADDEMHSVEIEVWKDGATDIFLGISRPVSDIKALYGKT